eukprot:TRINITY_DN4418_c0_g1_i3.p1 TRINITY_DN4418_c0_g1~~TRINITY_DN4418_c0_g1_i3.p1  ORF type:complete len:363 (-),score=63.18 TRINITY_DN4418_c0_g1_i3:945-1904(-)
MEERSTLLCQLDRVKIQNSQLISEVQELNGQLMKCKSQQEEMDKLVNEKENLRMENMQILKKIQSLEGKISAQNRTNKQLEEIEFQRLQLEEQLKSCQQELQHQYKFVQEITKEVQTQEALSKEQLLQQKEVLANRLFDAETRVQQYEQKLGEDQQELKIIRRENRRLSLSVNPQTEGNEKLRQISLENLNLHQKLEEQKEQQQHEQQQYSQRLEELEKQRADAEITSKKCALKYKGMEYRLRKDFQAIIDGIKDASENGKTVAEQPLLQNILQRINYTASLEFAYQYYMRKSERLEKEKEQLQKQKQVVNYQMDENPR